MINTNDMNYVEFKRYFYSSKAYTSLNIFLRCAIMLYVIQLTFKKKHIGGWKHYYRVNPYNPISYVFVVLCSIYLVCLGIFNTVIELFGRNPFKYS